MKAKFSCDIGKFELDSLLSFESRFESDYEIPENSKLICRGEYDIAEEELRQEVGRRGFDYDELIEEDRIGWDTRFEIWKLVEEDVYLWVSYNTRDVPEYTKIYCENYVEKLYKRTMSNVK